MWTSALLLLDNMFYYQHTVYSSNCNITAKTEVAFSFYHNSNPLWLYPGLSAFSSIYLPSLQSECAITVKSCTALPGSNVAWLRCVLVGCCEAAGVREGFSFWVWSVHTGLYKNAATMVAPGARALSVGWERTQWHSRLRVGAGLRRQL